MKRNIIPADMTEAQIAKHISDYHRRAAADLVTNGRLVDARLTSATELVLNWDLVQIVGTTIAYTDKGRRLLGVEL